MFGNDRHMSESLDNHITGHYGEDQFKAPRKPRKYTAITLDMLYNEYIACGNKRGSLTAQCIIRKFAMGRNPQVTLLNIPVSRRAALVEALRKGE